MKLNERAFGLTVAFLGVALILCIGGIVGLSAVDKAIPDALQLVTGLVGGGLVGLLSQTPQQAPPYRAESHGRDNL